MIEKDIKINRAESSGDFEKARKIRKQDFPWDGVKGKEFEATGVEGELSSRSNHLHFLPSYSLLNFSSVLQNTLVLGPGQILFSREYLTFCHFRNRLDPIRQLSLTPPSIFLSPFQVSLCNL